MIRGAKVDRISGVGMTATMIYATQLKDIAPWKTDVAREVVHTLINIPHFHYYAELSDIWCLFDDEKFVAWMWLVPSDGPHYDIKMIDTLVRGKGYAEKLLVEVMLGHPTWHLRPVDIVPEAIGYWKKLGYEED